MMAFESRLDSTCLMRRASMHRVSGSSGQGPRRMTPVSAACCCRSSMASRALAVRSASARLRLKVPASIRTKSSRSLSRDSRRLPPRWISWTKSR
ncbi:hypothetical protein D3C86_1851080 [compost metagenome]